MQVTILDLRCVGLTDAFLSRILPAVALQCPDLCELDLSGNALTSSAMSELVSTVLHSETLRLRRLNLAGNKLKRDGLCILAAGISGHMHLEVLNVTDTDADHVSLQALFEALVVQQLKKVAAFAGFADLFRISFAVRSFVL